MNIGERGSLGLSKSIPVRTKTKDLKCCTENVRNERPKKGGIL